jgi:hypothetical protein
LWSSARGPAGTLLLTEAAPLVADFATKTQSIAALPGRLSEQITTGVRITW